jgi:hypothetical protein
VRLYMSGRVRETCAELQAGRHIYSLARNLIWLAKLSFVSFICCVVVSSKMWFIGARNILPSFYGNTPCSSSPIIWTLRGILFGPPILPDNTPHSPVHPTYSPTLPSCQQPRTDHTTNLTPAQTMSSGTSIAMRLYPAALAPFPSLVA